MVKGVAVKCCFYISIPARLPNPHNKPAVMCARYLTSEASRQPPTLHLSNQRMGRFTFAKNENGAGEESECRIRAVARVAVV
jgi:hypothetical protein